MRRTPGEAVSHGLAPLWAEGGCVSFAGRRRRRHGATGVRRWNVFVKPATTHFLGLPKLPTRYAGVVMPLLLSVLMTFIVSLISTLRGVGVGPDLLRIWMGSWAISWMVAFPCLLALLPLVRRMTAALVHMPLAAPQERGPGAG